MKQVILDTNFILACLRQKIDFFNDLKFMGLEIVIPKQVINELKKLERTAPKRHIKEDCELALKWLEKNSYETIDFGGRYVDKGIFKLTQENKNIIIATLDRELKKKIKNPKIVIKGKKKLEIF